MNPISPSQTNEPVEQELLFVVREYERVIYKVRYLYIAQYVTLGNFYQEVILDLWKAYPRFRRECKVSTWVYRITLNAYISFICKKKNISEIVALTRETDRLTEERDELTKMLRQPYRMINQPRQLDKSAVLLCLEEKSYEEISEITGLTVTNVAARLSQVEDKLKEMKKEE